MILLGPTMQKLWNQRLLLRDTVPFHSFTTLIIFYSSEIFLAMIRHQVIQKFYGGVIGREIVFA